MQEGQNNLFINVYRILPCVGNTLFCCDATQMYHSGLQVYNTEFSYGGGVGEGSGITRGVPRAAVGCTFSESIPIGRTELDILEAMSVVRLMAADWTLDAYDPFDHNCNHFTDALCTRLTESQAPDWLNRFTSCAWLFRPIMNCCMRCADWIVEYDLLPTEVDLPPETSLASMDTLLHQSAISRKILAAESFTRGDYPTAVMEYSKSLSYMKRYLDIVNSDLDEVNQLSPPPALSPEPESKEPQEQDGQVQAWASAEDAASAWSRVETITQGNLLVATLHCNLAACYLKGDNAKEAITACNDSLSWLNENPKALFRRGCAYCLLNEYEAAIIDLQAAAKLAPLDKKVRAKLKDAKNGLLQQRQEEKQLCVRMFTQK